MFHSSKSLLSENPEGLVSLICYTLVTRHTFAEAFLPTPRKITRGIVWDINTVKCLVNCAVQVLQVWYNVHCVDIQHSVCCCRSWLTALCYAMR
jgi:hypothetical protein